ncbi:MAG: hypothetical protein NTU62_09935 [Spirochaetes bacterium]|nr:hypothetical protein [Spirochaetota bacterium]
MRRKKPMPEERVPGRPDSDGAQPFPDPLERLAILADDAIGYFEQSHNDGFKQRGPIQLLKLVAECRAAMDEGRSEDAEHLQREADYLQMMIGMARGKGV